jgi:hypothetical protein
MRQACACASAAQEVPNTEDGSICPALTGRPDLWSYGLCLLHGVPVRCGVDPSRPAPLSLFYQASRFGTKCTELGTSRVGGKGLIIHLTLLAPSGGRRGTRRGWGSARL